MCVVCVEIHFVVLFFSLLSVVLLSLALDTVNLHLVWQIISKHKRVHDSSLSALFRKNYLFRSNQVHSNEVIIFNMF